MLYESVLHPVTILSTLSSAGVGALAALLRFRPIMMTTLTALLGSLPLALGTGGGSELRRPLGIAVVGGLLVSLLLTLYTTPVIFIYLAQLRDVIERRLRGEQPASGGGIQPIDPG